MAQLLTTFPGLPDSTQQVTLGGVQYRVRLYWQSRMRAWFLDWRQLDDTALFLGRRVSPGSAVNAGMLPVSADPDDYVGGWIVVVGPSEYDQDWLGEEVQLLFMTEAEVPEVEVYPLILVRL